MQPNEFFAIKNDISGLKHKNSEFLGIQEENPALDFLANLMDPSLLYFDDKRSDDQPVVLNKPDIAVLARILDQAESSH